jgi:hypothetical protein
MHYVDNRQAVGWFLHSFLRVFCNEAGRPCFRPRALFLCILTTLSAYCPSSCF